MLPSFSKTSLKNPGSILCIDFREKNITIPNEKERKIHVINWLDFRKFTEKLIDVLINVLYLASKDTQK